MRDYPREVNAAFVARHGDGKNLSSVQRLNRRHEAAKAKLFNERSSLITKLESKAKAEHVAEMNEWNMILDDISLADDVGRYVLFPPLILDFTDGFSITRARDTLFDAAFPLLQAICSYAGCYVTLIAGNPENDDSGEGFFTA